MTDSSILHATLAKLDEFAATLSSEEQAVLADVLNTDGAEVAGFSNRGWPGSIKILGEVRVGEIAGSYDTWLSSGHTTGSNAKNLGGALGDEIAT